MGRGPIGERQRGGLLCAAAAAAAAAMCESVTARAWAAVDCPIAAAAAAAAELSALGRLSRHSSLPPSLRPAGQVPPRCTWSVSRSEISHRLLRIAVVKRNLNESPSQNELDLRNMHPPL